MSKNKKIVISILAVTLFISLFFTIYTLVRVNSISQVLSATLNDNKINDADDDRPSPSNENNVRNIRCVQSDIVLGSDPSTGDPNAPVTIIEYSDFECPFCARFVSNTYSRIKSEYVDTGKVQLVFKDFPLDSHPLAVPTAIAANCVANELGDAAFFAYHDLVFLQHSRLSEATIDSWAKEVGLSDKQLDACRNDSEMTREIFDDKDEGSRAGITGTPSFIINGELLVGARPYADFQESIERALAGEGCQES